MRVSYRVAQDGAVSDVSASRDADCVGIELVRWVGSFRYEPLAEVTAATLDWMPVLPH